MLQYRFITNPFNMVLLNEVLQEMENILATTQKPEEKEYYTELLQFLALIKENTIFEILSMYLHPF